MKTKEQILLDCFLGVIDFNEAAALAAMDEYAKQESAELLEALIWCSKKLNNVDGIGLDDIDNRMKEAIKKATQ